MFFSKLLQMALVVLLTSSTSPWTVPGDFKAAGHTVTLIGSGGNGGVGTSGASGTAGGGGGGGACTQLVYSSGTMTPNSTTVPFLINAGNSANATQWQSSAAGSGAYYEALSGGAGASAGTAGTAGGATTTVGTPTITYTPTNHTGGAGGTGAGANTHGAGGGGGSGGPAANGGAGGSPTGTGGGGGGGGGAANTGGSPSTATGGTGGNGSSGTGGPGGATGTAGTGSSGGGGGNGTATAGTASTGGLGGSGTDFTATAGCGGGGGGSGRNTNTASGTPNSIGGNGGTFGGGGGGSANTGRGTGTNTAGSGQAGVIAIVYSSTAVGYEQQGCDEAQPLIRRPLGRQAGAGIRQRNAFRFFGFIPSGFDQTGPQDRHPTPERRAAGIMRGDDGTEAVYVFVPPGVSIFFDVQDASDNPLTKWYNPRSQYFAGVTRGDDGIEWPFINWFKQGWDQYTSQPRRPRPTASALRHRPGFTWFAWTNFGFEQSYSQPVYRWHKSPDIGDPGNENVFTVVAPTAVAWPFEQFTAPFKRAPKPGTFDVGDVSGIDRPFTQWINQGYEQSYSQPLHRWFKSPDVGNPFIQSQFVQWRNAGWEVQPLQPKKSPFTRPSILEVGSPGIDRPFTQWINQGWAQVEALVRYQRLKSPDIGDPGNENVFVGVPPPTAFWGWDLQKDLYARRKVTASALKGRSEFGFFDPWINQIYEQVYTQPLHRWYKSPDIGDGGIENVFSFVPTTAVIYGWDQVYTQPLHKFFKAGAVKGKTEAAFFPPWVNYGYEQVYTQPLHRWFKSPDAGDAGIQAPYVFVPPGFVPWAWDPQPWQPRYKWNKAPEFGDQGTQFTYINWRNFGFEQGASQDRHRWFKSPDIGDSGIESPFTFWRNAGWEQVYSQPLHRLFKSPDIGDLGIENVFVPPATAPPWGFAFQEALRRKLNLGPGIEGLSQFAVFPSWTNFGFEQAYAHLPHHFFKSPDIGDGGIENVFSFVPPTAVIYGWDQVYTQPLHKFFKAGAVKGKTEAAFFPPWVNYGWPQVETLTRHRWYKSPDVGDLGIASPYVQWRNIWQQTEALTRYRWLHAPEIGDQGIESPLINWFNQGWDQYTSQPVHRWFKSPDVGDAGNEAVFVFIPPPAVISGWDLQKDLYARPKRTMSALKGRSEFAFFDPWVNLGSEQTYAHLPQRFFKSPEFGDSGIERPFIPPTPPAVWWDMQAWQPRHKWYAAPEYGDQGIEFPFIYWRNFGWEIQPPQPPSAALIHGRMAGGLMRGDDGNQATYIFWLPVGWEVQPPQPPSSSLIHARAGAIMRGDDGTEAVYIFVPPPVVTGLFMPGLFGATTHVGRAGYTPEPNP